MPSIRSKTIEGVLDHVFSKAHVPAFEPQLGTHYPTLPTIFPTRKSAAGMILARSPLMRHGLMHLDTDPDVEAIAGYPFDTVYWSASSSAESGEVKRIHHADVALRRRNGSVVFIDYVNMAIQAERPWQERQIAELQAHYAEEFDAEFALHDERCVYGLPIWNNVSLMWNYMPSAADIPQIKDACHAIMRAGLPMTIVEMAHVVARVDGLPSPLIVRAADLAFTAAMQLVIAGVADVDLSKPITTQSLITKRRTFSK